MVVAALEPTHRPRHRPTARSGRRRRRLHPVVLRPAHAAADPALAWGQGHAWLFPIGVDMALVFFEVLLLGASMVRITEQDRVVQYQAIPFLLMPVAAAGTLYQRHPRPHPGPPPGPGRARGLHPGHFLGLAYLLKMLAAASGAAAIHLAPSPGAQLHVRNADVLHGELSATSRCPACTSQQAPPDRCPAGRLRNSTKAASRPCPVTQQREPVGVDQAPSGRGVPGRARPRPARPPDHSASAAARELTGTSMGCVQRSPSATCSRSSTTGPATTRQQANGRRRTC